MTRKKRKRKEERRPTAGPMSPQDVARMRAAGRFAGELLDRLGPELRPGMTTADIDRRVKEAAAAGEHVVYGDAARREVLSAAGLLRARALVVTIADCALALRILAQVRELRPGLPVVVRMLDDTDLERLREAAFQP